MSDTFLEIERNIATKSTDRFRPVAVVDWVSFVVNLRSASHGGYLKRAYEAVGVSKARPINAGAGGAATDFRIDLQHPVRYQVISDLLDSLERSHGLVREPALAAIEVSLDLWPRNRAATTGSELTRSLMMGIRPPVIENPRIADRWGSELLPTGNHIDPEKTLYVGNKDDDLLWRVYWKRTDETFVGDDGVREAKPLPESEWRARAEVRIQGDALAGLGLAVPRDLANYPFQRLGTSGYFKFCRHAKGVPVLEENCWSKPARRSLGVDEQSPACVLGRLARFDSRGRPRGSRYLVTDTGLTDVARTALRNLSRRFNA